MTWHIPGAGAGALPPGAVLAGYDARLDEWFERRFGVYLCLVQWRSWEAARLG
jgi:hypothetical protein